MQSGVRLRRLLRSSVQSRFWRGLGLAFIVMGLLPWLATGLPIRAQAPAPPLLIISEVHPASEAVEDQLGEWIEIFNPGPEAVNLYMWRLVNQENASYQIPIDLWVPAGGYLVLASHADPAQNGGVQTTHVYTPFSIANLNESLTLFDAQGQLVDSLAWGEGTALVVKPGVSLERSAPDANAPWLLAHSPWPGSAGDLGSPGAPYAPPPTATPLPTPTLTVTPLPAIPPRLFLSEIMANPAAVGDDVGEWIELYNGDSIAVNLNGWILADQGNDQAILSGDLWLQPGSYLVLAGVGDPAQNGGVTVQMSYSGLQLANESDELLLIAPWGAEVDHLYWDGSNYKITEGASLERTGFDPDARWATAYFSWPGSAGDLGSPGAPYSPPPTLTPTPSPTPLPTATPLPSPTPTLTPPPAVPPHLLLSEMMANPAAVGDDVGQWI
jgi:hypothetical protein